MLHRKGPREGRKNSDFFFLSVLFCCSSGNIKQKQNVRNLGDGLVINGWAWAAKRQMANVNTSSLSSANAECYASFLGCADMNAELFLSFFFLLQRTLSIEVIDIRFTATIFHLSLFVFDFSFRQFRWAQRKGERAPAAAQCSICMQRTQRSVRVCGKVKENRVGGWATEKDIWIYVTDVPSCLTGCILPHKRTTNRLKDTK